MMSDEQINKVTFSFAKSEKKKKLQRGVSMVCQRTPLGNNIGIHRSFMGSAAGCSEVFWLLFLNSWVSSFHLPSGVLYSTGNIKECREKRNWKRKKYQLCPLFPVEKSQCPQYFPRNSSSYLTAAERCWVVLNISKYFIFKKKRVSGGKKWEDCP